MTPPCGFPACSPSDWPGATVPMCGHGEAQHYSIDGEFVGCLACEDAEAPSASFDFFDFITDPAHEGFVLMFADLLKGFDSPPWRKRGVK